MGLFRTQDKYYHSIIIEITFLKRIYIFLVTVSILKYIKCKLFKTKTGLARVLLCKALEPRKQLN